MHGAQGLALLVWALVACVPLYANADNATAGVTINFATGTHAEARGTQTVPLVPALIFEVRVPLKRFALFAQGVPPLAVGYQNGNALFLRGTRISYVAAALLYELPDRRTSLGIGEALYNQETTYEMPGPFGPARGSDRSRVAGARYEIRRRFWQSRRALLDASFALTPTMHANTVEDFTEPTYRSNTIYLAHTRYVAAETGSQVDAEIRLSVPRGRTTILYGVRYVNYQAHFDASGQLSDRNALLLPFVGWSTALR